MSILFNVSRYIGSHNDIFTFKNENNVNTTLIRRDKLVLWLEMYNHILFTIFYFYP